MRIRSYKAMSAFIMISIISCMITGCWNYQEIEKLAIVSGAAIDRSSDGKLLLTVEIVDVSQGSDKRPGSEIIALSGDSMFDIERRMISESGPRLYWSHAKIFVISQEIARSGAAKILDWLSRDSKTRSDTHLAVSGEKTAGEILTSIGLDHEPTAYRIDDMTKNEKNVSTAPNVQIWDYANLINMPGKQVFLPVIYLLNKNNKQEIHYEGSAVFKGDKMVGIMDGNKTKSALFARNGVKGGIITLGDYAHPPGISFEIFECKTKLQPVMINGEVGMQVNTDIITSVGEAEDNVDFYTDKGRAAIENQAEKALEHQISSVIERVQKQYKSDIFGFGEAIHKKKPKEWRKLSANWDDEFEHLKTNVKVKVEVKNTAEIIKSVNRR